MGSGEPGRASGREPKIAESRPEPECEISSVRLTAASRIVVKVGTNTLTDANGRIDLGFIADLTAQLAAQHGRGRDVLLVSSGAIRAGRERLATVEVDAARASRRATPPASRGAEGQGAPPASDTLPYKQAAAAIGQGLLIRHYTEAFAWRNVPCAQVLLTRDDLSDRSRFLNARNTLLALLSLGAIPVINENDTVAVDEIKFGDNDALAALVATLVDADLLLILSDVDGLYDRPPSSDDAERAESERPRLISSVARIDTDIASLAGTSTSGVGTGGMQSKIEAARIATAAGIRTVIARGRRERVIEDVVAEREIGTTFLPAPVSDRLSARKRWLAHGARSRGAVQVNDGARQRLLDNGVSLLAVGITAVTGSFASGDLIEIRGPDCRAFARGLCNYGDSEVRRVMGLRSDQFESALGYKAFEEVVHRDNLVLKGGSPAAE